MTFILALLIGIVAGLRTMTAPAAISWAARLGWLHLDGTWLAFMEFRWTPWIFAVLALAEYATDQLPSTPSRTVPMQFGARLVSGGLCGAAIGLQSGSWIIGVILGLVGAVVGTYGGAAVRGRLATQFGSDRPAAFLEDAVAVVGAAFIINALR